MRRPGRGRRTELALASGSVVIGAAALLAGCAAAPESGPARAGNISPAIDGVANSPGGSMFAGLERLASSEPAFADDTGAFDPDALLAALAAESLTLEPPELPADIEPDQAARVQAGRLYAEGRLRVRAGDGFAAARLLQQAVSLDPQSPTLRVALGEARLEAGLRRSALVTLNEAIALGADGTRPMLLVGLESARSGERDRARVLLARALRSPGSGTDPVIALVGGAALGEVLLEENDPALRTDGARLLLASLDLPARLGAPTQYTNELTDLFRRRPDLARRASAALASAGEFALADEAFALAVETAGVGRRDAEIRRAAFLAEQDRPATAGLLLMRSVRDGGGRVDDRLVGAVASLGEDDRLRRALRDALTGLSAALDADASPTVLAGLARARATVLGPRAGSAALIESLGTQARIDGILEDLARLVREQGDANLAVRTAEARPDRIGTLADALIAAGADGPALIDDLQRRRSPIAGALAAVLHGRLGLLREPPRPDWSRAEGLQRAAAAQVAAVAALQTGDWTRMREAIAAIEEVASTTDDPRVRTLYARALLASRQTEPGMTQLRLATDETSTFGVLELARAELQTGDASAAAAALERAALLDADDERVAEQVLGLHGNAGALPDEAKVGAALRALRERAPSSRPVRVLALREVLGAGNVTDAGDRLRTLAEDRPGGAAVVPLLEQVLARIGDDEARADWVSWAERLAERFPATPAAHLAHAATLRAASRGDDAAATLASASDRVDAGSLRRAREALLTSVLGRGDEARASALERLESRGRSTGEVIEYIGVLIEEDRSADAADIAARELPAPDVFPLSSAERAALASLIERSLVAAIDDGDAGAAVLAIADAAERVGVEPSPGTTRARLLLELRSGSPESIAAGFEAGSVDVPVRVEAVRRLVEDDRADVAVGVMVIQIEAAADEPGDVLDAWCVELARTIADQADAALARAALDRLGERDLLRIAATTLLARFDLADRVVGDAAGDLRAEIAYVLSSFSSALGQDAFGEAMLELTLDERPDHPWAANDLGYRLADEGRDLDRAHRLIELAWAQLPDSASVADSLGWVRYKLGLLDDEQIGDEVRLGAISMLQLAASMPGGVENETVHDQLGDALWAAGRRDEAARSWQEAERIATQRLRVLRTGGRGGTPEGRRLSRLVILARSKQAADDAGLDPEVAPMIVQPRPRAADPEPPAEPAPESAPGPDSVND